MQNWMVVSYKGGSTNFILCVKLSKFFKITNFAQKVKRWQTILVLHSVQEIVIFVTWYCNSYFPGLILNVPSLFDPLSDYELFNDEFFWSLPKEMYSEEDGHNSRQQQVIMGKDGMSYRVCHGLRLTKGDDSFQVNFELPW